MVWHPCDFSQSSSEPATQRFPFSVHFPKRVHIVDFAQCSGLDGAHPEPFGRASQ